MWMLITAIVLFLIVIGFIIAMNWPKDAPASQVPDCPCRRRCPCMGCGRPATRCGCPHYKPRCGQPNPGCPFC